MVVFGKGIKFFGWMKKPNQKIKMLFIRPKNFILFRLQEFIVFYWSNGMVFFLGIVLGDHFLDLIFEDALKVFSIQFLVFSGVRELEMGSIFKKQ